METPSRRSNMVSHGMGRRSKKVAVVKYTIITLALFISILGVAYYSIEYVLPYSPIRPEGLRGTQLPVILAVLLSEVEKNYIVSRFTSVSEDSVSLQCMYIKPHRFTKPKGTIILLHGIADRKESMLFQAIDLLDTNYAVILFDLRAHGESGGDFCTYGFYEKYDVSKVITTALEKYGNIGPFGILGNSLGAAISIQTMGIDKRISCGIIENSFADLRETVYDYMGRLMFVRIESVADCVLNRSEQIAHFKVDSVQPEITARSIHVPVLMFHSEKDENISMEYSRRIFKNLPSLKKEFYIVHGAGHYNLTQVGGVELKEKIISFLNSNLH